MKLSLCFLGSEVAHFEAKRAPARSLPALDLDDDAPTLLMAKSALAPKPAAERKRAATAFAQGERSQRGLTQGLATPMLRAALEAGTRTQSRRAPASK